MRNNVRMDGWITCTIDSPRSVTYTRDGWLAGWLAGGQVTELFTVITVDNIFVMVYGESCGLLYLMAEVVGTEVARLVLHLVASVTIDGKLRDWSMEKYRQTDRQTDRQTVCEWVTPPEVYRTTFLSFFLSIYERDYG